MDDKKRNREQLSNLINFIMEVREGVRFDSAERPFQNFIPLNEKHFYPFAVAFNGSLRSVSVITLFISFDH